MTIIAGFRTHEGIVICGDTQETVSGISKRRAAKVKVEPAYGGIYENSDLAVSFCGAGEGPFIDLLTRKAWDRARGAASLDEACHKVERSIKSTYREYGKIYQTGQCPSVELIYGVKMEGDSKLFSANGPAVNEVGDFKSGGIGYYMADFLSARINPGYLSLYQCVILAAYILFQAKEHVDGCGGDSHIAVLRNDGQSGRVDQSRIEAWTKLLNRVDQQVGPILINAADLRSDDPVVQGLSLLRTGIASARKTAEKEIEASDDWDNWCNISTTPILSAEIVEGEETPPESPLQRDELGFLITPLSPQTSEDQL